MKIDIGFAKYCKTFIKTGTNIMKILKQTILKILFLSVFLSANVPSLFGMFGNEMEIDEQGIDFTQVLPGELSLIIFENLDFTDLGKAECVSKNWNCFANDWQVWQHKVEDNLPDNFSQIPGYDAAHWKNINFKDDWQKLNNKISQIKEKLESNAVTQSDSDNLDYLRNAKAMFAAIAYVNQNQNIDWNQFSQDSLFTYALKVLKSDENEFVKIRNQLFNDNLDYDKKSYINLSSNGLTNAKLAVLFPLILIKNENTNLIRLNISYSKLTSLPKSICKLASLQDLDLDSNQLTYLPESIGKLANLEWLCLPNNQLEKLPASIGNLASLQDLNLNSNQLTSLPESIGKLTRLTELSLNNNQLTSLPESIGKLTRLWKLYINNNQLTSLPESIGNLTRLWTLNLESNNGKVKIPNSLFSPLLDITGEHEYVNPEELKSEENENSMQIDEDRYWFCQIL